MQISKTLWQSIADLLAADTGALAAATAMHVHLVIAPFNPALSLETIGDLTLATFTGSTPKNCGTGAQQVFTDAGTGKLTLQLLEPAGGFTWECTVTPGAPETVYGFVVTDTADAVIHGSELLPAPLTISEAGQAVVVPNIRMAFLTSSPQ